MNVLNKTPKGTIGAFRFNNGILMGVYGIGNCVSLEYNPTTEQLELLINEEKVKEQNILVRHVNENWE